MVHNMQYDLSRCAPDLYNGTVRRRVAVTIAMPCFVVVVEIGGLTAAEWDFLQRSRREGVVRNSPSYGEQSSLSENETLK